MILCCWDVAEQGVETTNAGRVVQDERRFHQSNFKQRRILNFADLGKRTKSKAIIIQRTRLMMETTRIGYGGYGAS